LPSRLLQLLPAGTTLAGRDLHPLKNRAFPRHTVSGPHGLTVREDIVRPRIKRCDISRPPLPASTFMTIAIRPSW
jgi:hypothetical protein